MQTYDIIAAMFENCSFKFRIYNYNFPMVSSTTVPNNEIRKTTVKIPRRLSKFSWIEIFFFALHENYYSVPIKRARLLISFSIYGYFSIILH